MGELRVRDAPGVPVHAHRITDSAAQQCVDGDSQVPGGDVPQRLVDSTDRTAQDGSAAVEGPTVHSLPVVFDPSGVAPCEVFREVADHALDDPRLPFDNGLTPSDDTLVGLHRHEQPSRANVKGADLHYSHCESPLGAIFLAF